VEGQVATADLRLGRVLRQGEPILTLDARHLELQRAAIQVALRTSATSLAALRAQLAAEQVAHDAVIRVARSASKAARARVALDEKSLSFRERELSMVERLRGVAALSALDALRVAEGTEAQRAKLATTSAEAATDAWVGMTNLLDRVVRIATVQYSIAQAEADAEKLKAQVEILDHEIERRTVLAPVSGALADVLPLSAGATVTPPQRLATIVPDGSVRAVAFFAPDESLGRLRAGQAVTIRLDNFPWTQYGTLAGVVDQVGREPRDAKVRVEIRIAGRNAAIPLEHGLTAVCEVAVERISPFKLLLRSVGHWLEAPVEPPATTGASSSRTAGL
jgi:multidrug resistance efflux pump